MLTPNPNARHRAKELLQRVHVARTKRDEELDRARRLIEQDESAEQHVEFLSDVARTQGLKLVDQAAAMGREVQLSARAAEAAIREVKRLDALAGNVSQALEIVTGIAQQQQSVAGITACLRSGDVAKATELMVAYEAAARRCAALPQEVASPTRVARRDARTKKLRNGAHGDEGDAKGDVDEEDEDTYDDYDDCGSGTGGDAGLRGSASAVIMAQAKDDLLGQLRSQAAATSTANDKARLFSTCKLMAALGEEAAAHATYCGWVAERATAEIKDMVAKELAAIGGEHASRHSHLNLVSAVLDHVVATLEKEERDVVAAFGPTGMKALLLQLHHECTSSSVEVLRNFLSSRRVASSGNGGSGGSGPTTAKKPASKHVRGGSTSGGGSISFQPQQEPRQLDQTLEEISHLVSCCHLYMGFMEKKLAACADADAPKASGEAATTKKQQQQQRYSVAMTRGNALFDMIQDLLAIYIPLQSDFFDAAFTAAAELEAANAPRLSTAWGAAAAAGVGGVTGGGSDMGGGGGGGGGGFFASLYSSSSNTPAGASPLTRGPPSSSPQLAASDRQSAAASPLTLGAIGLEDEAELRRKRRDVPMIDDVFYFLRVAIHRAIETQNRHIVSATIIAVNNVIRDRLVPHVEQQYQATRRDGAPIDTIRWVNAMAQCRAYVEKLAAELLRLTDATFSGDELVQFREQHRDLVATATAVDKKATKTLHALASAVSSAMFHAAGLPESFVRAPYVLGSDDSAASAAAVDASLPWLGVALSHWGPLLDEVRGFASDAVAPVLLARAVALTAQGLEAAVMAKRFDILGALQLDKDVRALRSFFSERCDAPVRCLFARLVAITTILTVSSMAEAEEAAMTLGDDAAAVGDQAQPLNVAKLVALRVDFSRAS